MHAGQGRADPHTARPFPSLPDHRCYAILHGACYLLLPRFTGPVCPPPGSTAPVPCVLPVHDGEYKPVSAKRGAGLPEHALAVAVTEWQHHAAHSCMSAPTPRAAWPGLARAPPGRAWHARHVCVTGTYPPASIGMTARAVRLRHHCVLPTPPGPTCSHGRQAWPSAGSTLSALAVPSGPTSIPPQAAAGAYSMGGWQPHADRI